MAQQDNGTSTLRTEGAPQNTPRLRLKRKDSTSGPVDGAWWPHSDDLAGELPDLLTVLSVRLGPIMRVTYHRAEWPAAPGKIRIGDNVVRLDGFDRQPVDTVGISGQRGAEVILLVVPAARDADEAHAILMAAALTDDSSEVDTLLATAGAAG